MFKRRSNLLGSLNVCAQRLKEFENDQANFFFNLRLLPPPSTRRSWIIWLILNVSNMAQGLIISLRPNFPVLFDAWCFMIILRIYAQNGYNLPQDLWVPNERAGF